MPTEVMRFYGLARPPVDAGFFETEHHAQVSRDSRRDRNGFSGGLRQWQAGLERPSGNRPFSLSP
jgi:hypothetical protein